MKNQKIESMLNFLKSLNVNNYEDIIDFSTIEDIIDILENID